MPPRGMCRAAPQGPGVHSAAPPHAPHPQGRGIEIVLEIIENNRSTPVLHLRAVRVLLALCLNHAPNTQRLMDSEAVGLVCASIVEHMQEQELMAACTGLLATVATQEKHAQLLLDAGLVKLVLDVLARHSDAGIVIKKALRLLGHLVRAVPAPDELLSSGAVQAAIDIMTRHPKDAGVTLVCAWVVQQLAVAAATLRDAVCEAGGTRLLIDALRAFPAGANVTAQTIRTLVALCPSSANMQLMTEAQVGGMLSRILTRILEDKSPGQDVPAVAHICHLISELCVDSPANRDLLGSTGACSQLVKGMGVCAGAPDAQRLGAGAIVRLSQDHPENRRRFVEGRAVAVVVAAMRTHAGNADVLALCLHALEVLVLNHPAAQEGLVVEKGLDALVHCLELNHPSVIVRAINVLYFLLRSVAGQSGCVQGPLVISPTLHQSHLGQCCFTGPTRGMPRVGSWIWVVRGWRAGGAIRTLTLFFFLLWHPLSDVWWLPTNRHRLPTTRHRLPTTRHRLHTNCHRLPTTRHRLPTGCRRRAYWTLRVVFFFITAPPAGEPCKGPCVAKGPQCARIRCFPNVCHPVYPGTPPVYPWIKGIAACSLQTLSTPCRHCVLHAVCYGRHHRHVVDAKRQCLGRGPKAPFPKNGPLTSFTRV